MKRFFSAMAILFFFLTAASASWGNEIYYEGEGYIVPSEKSQEPFNPQMSPRLARSAGNIIVNPLASDFPNIILYTTVLDDSGNPIEGLTQNDFSVTEQSGNEASPTTEAITSFTETGAAGSSAISFVLVFDVSGSMDGSRLSDAKDAANQFVSNANPNDRGALVIFSSGGSERIVMASDWVATDSNNNNVYDITEAINGLDTRGSTAVYDGTAKGIENLSQEPSPKAVIVFTDGDTNDDESYSMNDVIVRANNEGVPLYTIGLGIDPQNLKDMASATGGAYYYAPTAQDMAVIYNDIGKNVRNQYTIGYTTHNPAFDSTIRTVTVEYGGTRGTGLYVVNSKPVISIDDTTRQLSTQQQSADAGLRISGTIADNDAQSQGQTLQVNLFYKHVNETEYSNIPLEITAQGNGVYAYEGVIPGEYVQEPAVQYYIYATDGIQENYLPFNFNKLPYSIAIWPNNSPEVTHNPVTIYDQNQPLAITVDVVEHNSDDSVSEVILYYRIPDPNPINTPYLPITMTSTDAVSYHAEIPVDNLTLSGIEYFISAWDNYQARTDFGTALSPLFIEPEDKCPDDPNKTDPGVCGCGIPDTDSDADGTPDCSDNCPNDPSKIEPGECGCGIADTDSDGDGIPDCNEKDDNDSDNGGCFIESAWK